MLFFLSIILLRMLPVQPTTTAIDMVRPVAYMPAPRRCCIELLTPSTPAGRAASQRGGAAPTFFISSRRSSSSARPPRCYYSKKLKTTAWTGSLHTGHGLRFFPWT